MSIDRPMNSVTQLSGESDRERKARLVWASVIIGLLGTQICMSMFAVFMATTTESLSVVPDYYNKAVGWDDQQEILKASEKLNWQTDIQAGPEIDVYGNRVLSIRVSDAANEAVDLDSISIDLFHHAHAREVIQPELEEVTVGFYQAKVRLPHDGLWELRVEADQGDNHYVKSFEIQIPAGK